MLSGQISFGGFDLEYELIFHIGKIVGFRIYHFNKGKIPDTKVLAERTKGSLQQRE